MFTGRKGKAKTQLSSQNLSNNNSKILQYKFSIDLDKPDTAEDGENIKYFSKVYYGAPWTTAYCFKTPCRAIEQCHGKMLIFIQDNCKTLLNSLTD